MEGYSFLLVREMNFQMNRDDVENLLDLKVSQGRMTQERKEELLKQYDDNQNGSSDLKYPRIEPQGIMSVPEMIITLILAIMLCVAAMKDIKWLILVLAGVLFIFAPYSTLMDMLKKKKRNGLYILVIAELCGILMLSYGLFLKFGKASWISAVDSAGGTIACVLMIVVGLGMVIGNLIVKRGTVQRCTQPVQAKCVELVHQRNSSGFRRTPLYEFYYGGENRTVQSGTYYRGLIYKKGMPKIGETREILINAETLDEYYDPVMSGLTTVSLVILAAFFVAMGILGLVLV